MAFTSLARRGAVLAVLALGAIAAALALGTRPAQAGLGLACPNPVYQAFMQITNPVDTSYYAAVPNGGFESGSTGWTLSGGAQVVAGNEPYYIGSPSDRSSLRLPAGATATSPPMCISLLSGHMRFVQGGDAGSNVHVQILYHGLLSSLLGILDGGTTTSNGTWQASESVGMLGGVLPLLTSSVQFRFVASNGTAQVDDVYLDPMRFG